VERSPQGRAYLLYLARRRPFDLRHVAGDLAIHHDSDHLQWISSIDPSKIKLARVLVSSPMHLTISGIETAIMRNR
jgi:hypothetical protein